MPGYLHLRMEFSAFFPAVFAEPVIPDIVIAPLLDLDQLRQFLSSLIIAAYHEINCHIGCRKLVFQHDYATAGQVPKPVAISQSLYKIPPCADLAVAAARILPCQPLHDLFIQNSAIQELLCEVELSEGQNWVDKDSRRFGFRWFEASGIGDDAVFRLNGKRIMLRSAISWSFWPVNGIFPSEELAESPVPHSSFSFL